MESEVFVFETGELFIKSEFIGKDIKVFILTGTQSYKCSITAAKLAEIETNLAGKFDHVAEMAQTTFREGSGDHFSLSAENQDGKPVLVWRKLGGGKLKIRLAVFDLEQIENDDSAYETLMRFLIKDRLKLKASLVKSQEEIENKSTELERALNLAEDLKNDQKRREEELIAEFLPILNNKKRRIEELEAQLEYDGSQPRQRANPMDNSYDVDTDEEQAVDDPNSREASPDLFTLDERDSGKGEPQKHSSQKQDSDYEDDLFDL